MALWIWFLSVGGVFFFIMYGAHGAQMKGHRHDVCHELPLGKQKAADARSAASSLRINPLRDMNWEPHQAPSSMYRGHEWFFDSAEHRDMFEADQHEPVASRRARNAPSQEQQGRRIQRQGGR